jgi:hypothetical protein
VAPRRASAAALLPPWDEYVVAYKDRSAALAHLPVTPDPLSTVGSPLVLLDGRVHGTWSRTLTAGAVRIEVDWWIPPTPAHRRATTRAAQRYGRYLAREARCLDGG